jgi:hypothetical protein
LVATLRSRFAALISGLPNPPAVPETLLQGVEICRSAGEDIGAERLAALLGNLVRLQALLCAPALRRAWNLALPGWAAMGRRASQ